MKMVFMRHCSTERWLGRIFSC